MTTPLSGIEVGERVRQKLPEAVFLSDGTSLWINREHLIPALSFLKEELELDYLANLTAVDYWDYFEVVYNLVSLRRNHSLTVKTRCPRDDPKVPSVTPLWKGAELQEREVYDLMGVEFEGHPDLRRVLLWEGFEGHPLRKDFLEWH